MRKQISIGDDVQMGRLLTQGYEVIHLGIEASLDANLLKKKRGPNYQKKRKKKKKRRS